MNRKEFIKLMALAPLSLNAGGLSELAKATEALPRQGRTMPVIFTSHGNPMTIIEPREKNRFWMKLFELGRSLRSQYEIRAALVVSAHWCTRGTQVNVSPRPEQVFDYYGFPKEYYEVHYSAPGAPEAAREAARLVAPRAKVDETTEWGLDHGAWPVLMHLFPGGDMPVFQMSIDYHAEPAYHYEVGRQLKALRDKGVLVIGSGALVHNIPMTMRKFQRGDATLYGWENEYDAWIKRHLDARDFTPLIQYPTSHKLAALAAPTPDHFVPLLYSLGAMDAKDELVHFHDEVGGLPAFSERSFILQNA